MLGKLYLTGQSVQPDQVQAIVWFGRSAEGNQYAQFFLERHDDIRPPSVMLAVTRLLYHMSRSFEDCSLPRSSTVCASTGSAGRNSRRGVSLWATSRMTMRMSSIRMK